MLKLHMLSHARRSPTAPPGSQCVGTADICVSGSSRLPVRSAWRKDFYTWSGAECERARAPARRPAGRGPPHTPPPTARGAAARPRRVASGVPPARHGRARGRAARRSTRAARRGGTRLARAYFESQARTPQSYHIIGAHTAFRMRAQPDLERARGSGRSHDRRPSATHAPSLHCTHHRTRLPHRRDGGSNSRSRRRHLCVCCARACAASA